MTGAGTGTDVVALLVRVSEYPSSSVKLTSDLDGLVYVGVGDHVGGTGGVCDVVIGAIGAADPLVAEYGVREPVGVGDGGSPRGQRFSYFGTVPAIVGCPVAAATLGVATTTSVAWLVYVFPSTRRHR